MAFDLDSMFFSFGNVHIISGPNGMCECGKDGKTCYEQLASVASKYMELNATSTNTGMLSASQIAAFKEASGAISEARQKLLESDNKLAVVWRQLQHT